MPLVLQILLPIAVGVVCAVIAFIAGSNHRKHTAEAEIGSAEQEAKRLVNEAIKTAEAKKKETILEGKDILFRWGGEGETPPPPQGCTAPGTQNPAERRNSG